MINVKQMPPEIEYVAKNVYTYFQSLIRISDICVINKNIFI